MELQQGRRVSEARGTVERNDVLPCDRVVPDDFRRLRGLQGPSGRCDLNTPADSCSSQNRCCERKCGGTDSSGGSEICQSGLHSVNMEKNPSQVTAALQPKRGILVVPGDGGRRGDPDPGSSDVQGTRRSVAFKLHSLSKRSVSCDSRVSAKAPSDLCWRNEVKGISYRSRRRPHDIYSGSGQHTSPVYNCEKSSCHRGAAYGFAGEHKSRQRGRAGCRHRASSAKRSGYEDFCERGRGHADERSRHRAHSTGPCSGRGRYAADHRSRRQVQSADMWGFGVPPGFPSHAAGQERRRTPAEEVEEFRGNFRKNGFYGRSASEQMHRRRQHGGCWSDDRPTPPAPPPRRFGGNYPAVKINASPGGVKVSDKDKKGVFRGLAWRRQFDDETRDAGDPSGTPGVLFFKMVKGVPRLPKASYREVNVASIRSVFGQNKRASAGSVRRPGASEDRTDKADTPYSSVCSTAVGEGDTSGVSTEKMDEEAACA
ncbi:hypothetical protein CSUI_009824 [Cystoisospora suis]|uniref:Uncharacterized protein n=1 Tax=Cystoisospora suis TaxID=483139 RepID=A0A2C6JF39_9APIC|nr:hypothetical protein CSUI_009824 [Cystoisospora suis]